MILIGIAGPSGSGKTTICKFFKDNGCEVFELDKIAKEFYSEAIPDVKKVFGEEVIKADGNIDTKVLGKMVFADRKKMDKLNAIMLPLIWKGFIGPRFYDSHKNDGVIQVLDAPVLFESTWDMITDYVLFVDADREVRIQRLIKGRKIETSLAEIQADIFDYSKVSISPQDLVIDTTNGKDNTHELAEWFAKIKKAGPRMGPRLARMWEK